MIQFYLDLLWKYLESLIGGCVVVLTDSGRIEYSLFRNPESTEGVVPRITMEGHFLHY